MHHHHIDKHKGATLMLSAVLVLGTLGIVHNFSSIHELVSDAIPVGGYVIGIAPNVRPLNTDDTKQTAQVGQFGESFNAAAISWYKTVCDVVRICNN